MTQSTAISRASLLYAIAASVNRSGAPAPQSIDMYPGYGLVMLRFDTDDVAAVDAWAGITGATVVHGGTTFADDIAWHEYGTRPGGRDGDWCGWRVQLWCVVTGPAPVAAPPDGEDLAEALQANGIPEVFIEQAADALQRAALTMHQVAS